MQRIGGFFQELFKNRVMLLMVLPGALWFLIYSYLPMFGTIIAFKNYRFHPDGFIAGILNSDWVGFKNFEFLFSTNDAYIITRNTILYNVVFIILGLILAVGMAIVLSEIASKKLSKLYQTSMFLPFFMSWVIVGYFTFSFLSSDRGLINSILQSMGMESIQWYADSKYWPFILVIVFLWKTVGYNSVIYLASILGIDKSYYEAAMIDGASKFQQIRCITLPLLKPIITIMTLLAIGKIFYADFGLFYQVPRNSGALYETTNVIDTFVYRGLKSTGEIGMSSAAGLYQSLVGFVLVLVSNYIVTKYDKDNALF